MAREGGLGSILPLAIVGGLGWWAYSSGWFSSLFGTSTATAPATTPPAGGTNPVPASPPAPPPAPPPVAVVPPACNGKGILAPLLASVQKLPNGSNYGTNLPGTYTIDEWGYYLNQLCSGMADQYKLTADNLFPGRDDRGGPLNWSAFSGYAQQVGLSAANPRNRGRRVGRRVPRMIGTHVVRRVA